MGTLLDHGVSYVLQGSLADFRDAFIECGGRVCDYPLGRLLTRAGEQEPTMYYLLEGMVKVFTTNASGYLRILGYHKQDTLFALDRLCQGEASVVSTQAVTPVRVVPVTWEALRAIEGGRPEFGEALLREVTEVLRLMCFDAESKSGGDVAVRLASFLWLMRSHQLEAGDPDAGVVRLTQDELASAVNASRVQVARACRRFREAGLIATGRGSVAIVDADGFAEMLCGR